MRFMTIQILDKSKFSCYNEFMVLSKKRARKVIEEIIALYPDAKPSLDFRNHFELVCAVLLSAQTTDAAVNKATPGLFAAFPTPQAMAAAEVKDIEPYISRLGLYRNKAKFLKDCAQQLMERHNGIVPQTREELEALAGVGRKTANVVLSVGFGIPAFAVDTHVGRICKHHDIVKKSATPLETKKRVMEVLPPELWLPAHQPMIYLGREVCHPKNPECKKSPQLYNFD
ncbi:Predicted EndoIII-related endonuclease [Streptococcus suis 05ZYH33]|nr:Predicted EndoIII-related endonuclease [Streptococcus suis 05ZYH33]